MITVLGSINVDLTFPLSQLPSPGETALTSSLIEAFGGKGANQAVAAARDGAVTRFIGCVGADAFGLRARQALADEGIDVSGLATASGATGLASIWIDGSGRNVIAVASGANGAVKAIALDAGPLMASSLVVLQMEIPTSEVEAAIARAKGAGARVLLNLAPAIPLSVSVLRNVDVLVLNEHEAAALCAHVAPQGGPAGPPEAHLRALAGLIGATVIITLGSEGAIAAHRSACWRVAALPVTAVDTTGAGDCFVGVLAAALARNATLPHAMRRAAVAGSLACTVMGAQPSFPTAERIDAALATAPTPERGRL
jgi:ribokinase